MKKVLFSTLCLAIATAFVALPAKQAHAQVDSAKLIYYADFKTPPDTVPSAAEQDYWGSSGTANKTTIYGGLKLSSRSTPARNRSTQQSTVPDADPTLNPAPTTGAVYFVSKNNTYDFETGPTLTFPAVAHPKKIVVYFRSSNPGDDIAFDFLEGSEPLDITEPTVLFNADSVGTAAPNANTCYKVEYVLPDDKDFASARLRIKYKCTVKAKNLFVHDVWIYSAADITTGVSAITSSLPQLAVNGAAANLSAMVTKPFFDAAPAVTWEIVSGSASATLQQDATDPTKATLTPTATAGMVQVKVTVNGVSVTKDIEVVAPVVATSVTITGAAQAVVGDTLDLSAAVLPALAVPTTTWSIIEGGAYAELVNVTANNDDNNLVRLAAKAAGTVKVMVKVNETPAVTDTLTVTVLGKYVITLNANGGDVTPATLSVVQSKAVGTLPVPTRIGYAFVEWNTAQDGSGTAYTAATVYDLTSDATLYAQWEQKAPELTESATKKYVDIGMNCIGATSSAELTVAKSGQKFIANKRLDTLAAGTDNAVIFSATASTAVNSSNKEIYFNGGDSYVGVRIPEDLVNYVDWHIDSASTKTIALVTINGTSGSTTIPANPIVLFSDKTPFDAGAITGYQQIGLPVCRSGAAAVAKTLIAPANTKSLRIVTRYVVAEGDTLKSGNQARFAYFGFMLSSTVDYVDLGLNFSEGDAALADLDTAQSGYLLTHNNADTLYKGTTSEVELSYKGGCATGNSSNGVYLTTGTLRYFSIDAFGKAVQLSLTEASKDQNIARVTINGTSNNVENGATPTIVYSDKLPFDSTSVIGVEQITLPPARHALPAVTVSAPKGAKSFRIYKDYLRGVGDTLTSQYHARVAYVGIAMLSPLADIKAMTLDLNGAPGNNVSWQVLPGNVVGYLSTPAWTGYKFQGWNSAQNASGVRYTETTPAPAGDFTLYAQWMARIEYTLTFDATGGEVAPASKPVMQEEAIGALPVPTRSGYRFAGWHTALDSTGVEYTAETLYPLGANDTVYAEWHQEFTVTFDVNGGDPLPDSVKTLTAALTEAIGNLPKPTRADYMFAGWNATQDGSDTTYTATTVYYLAGNVTLYAQWISTAGIRNEARFADIGYDIVQRVTNTLDDLIPAKSGVFFTIGGASTGGGNNTSGSETAPAAKAYDIFPGTENALSVICNGNTNTADGGQTGAVIEKGDGGYFQRGQRFTYVKLDANNPEAFVEMKVTMDNYEEQISKVVVNGNSASAVAADATDSVVDAASCSIVLLYYDWLELGDETNIIGYSEVKLPPARSGLPSVTVEDVPSGTMLVRAYANVVLEEIGDGKYAIVTLGEGDSIGYARQSRITYFGALLSDMGTGPNPCDTCQSTAVTPDYLPALAAFPNPAKDVLFVSGLEGGETLTLYDVVGVAQLQMPPVVGKSVAVNVSQLPQGIYFLKAGKGKLLKTVRIYVLK